MGEEITLERGRQRRVPVEKIRYFIAVNSSSMKTVAVRLNFLLIIANTADELSGNIKSVTLNDIEPQNKRFY